MTPESKPAKPPRRTLDQTIIDLCAEAGPGKSVDPNDIARTIARDRGGDDMAWREWLGKIRHAAVDLARAGRLVIFRKGKPADPEDFRGVYRLGLPSSE